MSRNLVALAMVFVFVGAGFAGEKEIKVIRPELGYLGVQIRDVSSEDLLDLGLPAERGAYIEQVMEAGPAEDSGLQEGDVVVEYAGIPVLSVRQFQRLVSDTPPGREVSLGVWRAGSRLDINTTIGERTAGYTWFGPESGIHVEKHVIPDFDFDFDLENLPHKGRHVFHFAHPKVRLGVQVAPLSGQMADFLGIPGQEGVLIMEVMPDTAAAEAGFQAGDVILSVNGKDVSHPGELSRHLSEGSNDIEYARDQQVSSLQVELIKKEDSRSQEVEKM